MTLAAYSLDIAANTESEAASPTLARCGELASRVGLAVIFGASLLDGRTGRPRNQFCLARPDGSSRAIYAKIHPFSFGGRTRCLRRALGSGPALWGR